MATAREVMHVGAQCIPEHATLAAAAQRMRQFDVGALPVFDDDNRLVGIITDRDIVIRCVAEGLDPATTPAGKVTHGPPYTVDADASVEQAVDLMEKHKIRRLPVIDEQRLVGIISEADISRHLSDDRIAHFVESVCALP